MAVVGPGSRYGSVWFCVLWLLLLVGLQSGWLFCVHGFWDCDGCWCSECGLLYCSLCSWCRRLRSWLILGVWCCCFGAWYCSGLWSLCWCLLSRAMVWLYWCFMLYADLVPRGSIVCRCRCYLACFHVCALRMRFCMVLLCPGSAASLGVGLRVLFLSRSRGACC